MAEFALSSHLVASATAATGTGSRGVADEVIDCGEGSNCGTNYDGDVIASRDGTRSNYWLPLVLSLLVLIALVARATAPVCRRLFRRLSSGWFPLDRRGTRQEPLFIGDAITEETMPAMASALVRSTSAHTNPITARWLRTVASNKFAPRPPQSLPSSRFVDASHRFATTGGGGSGIRAAAGREMRSRRWYHPVRTSLRDAWPQAMGKRKKRRLQREGWKPEPTSLAAVQDGGEEPPPRESFPEWAFQTRPFFHFETLHVSAKSGARVGRIHTPHGVIDTPGFVAVATNATLKGADARQGDDEGQQLMFCNTYHLLLQPGPDIIAEAGGLHRFMNRLDQPLITDSGGFQVFSMAHGSVQQDVGRFADADAAGGGKGEGSKTGDSKGAIEGKARPGGGELKRASDRLNSGSSARTRRLRPPVVDEGGVTFQSYRDGAMVRLTPESTVQAQKKLGADIIIPLDELPPYHTSRERLAESVRLSHRWEERSLREHLKDLREQAMYGVVHGGVDRELREMSARFVSSLPFDGFAIGGSLGSCHDELFDLLDYLTELLPADKPRHLLGIADEISIRRAVELGIDTFDSAFPTRLARHGTVLTTGGPISIKNQANARAFGIPLDERCQCSTCRHYDRAYVNHLRKANELLAVQLVTVHNIAYMNRLMAGIRSQIMRDEI